MPINNYELCVCVCGWVPSGGVGVRWGRVTYIKEPIKMKKGPVSCQEDVSKGSSGLPTRTSLSSTLSEWRTIFGRKDKGCEVWVGLGVGRDGGGGVSIPPHASRGFHAGVPQGGSM